MRTVKIDRVPTTVSPRGPRIRRLLETQFVSIVEVMLSPGETLPPHSTPVDVVFYVRSGAGYIKIGDKQEFVTEGTLVESPKNVPHGLQAGDGPFDVLVLKTPNPNWKE